MCGGARPEHHRHSARVEFELHAFAHCFTQIKNLEAREGEKKEVRCEILAHQEKSGLPGKYHEDRGEKVVEEGAWFLRERERTIRGYCAHSKVEIEERDCSSSRQEGTIWKLKKNFLRLPLWLGQKEFGWENGPEGKKKLGESRSLRFRRGRK